MSLWPSVAAKRSSKPAMTHLTPLAAPNEPKPELLRREGWNVKAAHGQYCVVWRGHEEVVMVWRAGHWERAGGSSSAAA